MISQFALSECKRLYYQSHSEAFSPVLRPLLISANRMPVLFARSFVILLPCSKGGDSLREKPSRSTSLKYELRIASRTTTIWPKSTDTWITSMPKSMLTVKNSIKLMMTRKKSNYKTRSTIKLISGISTANLEMKSSNPVKINYPASITMLRPSFSIATLLMLAITCPTTSSARTVRTGSGGHSGSQRC